MSSFEPITPDHLRAFLRERLTPAQIRRMASADYDRDGDGIAREFAHNLETGLYTYAGDGNPYECAMMQRHDTTSNRPLDELFGAWWLGTFCSAPNHFFLIDNLGVGGVDQLLHMVVRGCGELGADSRAAAHAAIPFSRFLQGRTPHPESASFGEAIAALKAIESSETAAQTSGRYLAFMKKLDDSSTGV